MAEDFEREIPAGESEEAVEAPEQTSTERNAEQLKRVEQALRELAPVMEQFKDADKPKLEANAKEQIGKLEADFGERLGIESAQMIYKNLVEDVLATRDSLASATDTLRQEQAALKGQESRQEKKTGTAKQKFNYRVAQFGREFLNGDIPQFFKDFIRSNPSEERYEAAASQLTALHKEFMRDERIGEEKVKAFTERLKDIASALNASVQKEQVKPTPNVAEKTNEGKLSAVDRAGRDLTLEELEERKEAATARAEEVVEAVMADFVAPQPAQFEAKEIEPDATGSHDEDEEHGGTDTSSSDGTNASESSQPTQADQEVAKESINKSAVEETITNLVLAPETVLGDVKQESAKGQEKNVAKLLEALGGLYPSQEELIKRLKSLFGNYKIAWAMDRRLRPGLSEAAHKRAGMEDISRELPAKEEQAIAESLETGGSVGSDTKMTREEMITDFFKLVEAVSQVDTPDTSSLETEAA